jgi:hypothetical protein
MEEQIYFSDSAVEITSSFASFGERRYRTSDIVTASYDVNPADKSRSWHRLTQTGFGAMIGGCVLVVTKWLVELAGYHAPELISALLEYGPLPLAIFGSILLALRRNRYTVSITGSFGKADIVLAKREKYAEKIVEAIRKATKEVSKQQIATSESR